MEITVTCHHKVLDFFFLFQIQRTFIPMFLPGSTKQSNLAALLTAEFLARERVSGRYSIYICQMNEHFCFLNLYLFLEDASSLLLLSFLCVSGLKQSKLCGFLITFLGSSL